MLAAVRQRRDHVADRHPRHLRHPRLPRPRRPPAPARGPRYRDSPPCRLQVARDWPCRVLLASPPAALVRPRRRAGGRRATKVTLGFSAWPGWFPWQVAQEQGLFAKNKVDVELKYFDSYTDSLNALATGAIDANSQTLNDTLRLGQRRRKADDRPGQRQLDGQRPDHRGAGHQQRCRPQGQEGRRRAGHRGPLPAAARAAKAGLSEQDIQLVPLPTDAAAAAFVAGQVDAVGAFAPFTTTALARPGSRAVATSTEFPGAIPDHLVVSADSWPRITRRRCRPWSRPGSTRWRGSRTTRTRRSRSWPSGPG